MSVSNLYKSTPADRPSIGLTLAKANDDGDEASQPSASGGIQRTSAPRAEGLFTSLRNTYGILSVFAALILSSAAQAQFTQQGGKLVATTNTVGYAASDQGQYVALSGNAKIALVGAPMDNNSGLGAVWEWVNDGGQWVRTGPKLVVTPELGGLGLQGFSVALSADGNTAVVGAPEDNSTYYGSAGAAFIWNRNRWGYWTQGQKLVGSGATNGFCARQGSAVALSADGNTALVGGPHDDGSCMEDGAVGAVWVFTRTSNGWQQQGHKLVPLPATPFVPPPNSFFGTSLALSADGNTALVGAPGDNNSAGAAWLFNRINGVWADEGQKLVGSGAVGSAYQGQSVALSKDGNTAMVGGPGDNNLAGAVWVYTNSAAGSWKQQGPKLVGTGAIGPRAAEQGFSVALSADGKTAVEGGPYDRAAAGAVWEFTRNGEVWNQVGQKLSGSGATGSANQGWSVALSADGQTLIEGGPNDYALYDNRGNFAGFRGAVWVFFQEPRPSICTWCPVPVPPVVM